MCKGREESAWHGRDRHCCHGRAQGRSHEEQGNSRLGGAPAFSLDVLAWGWGYGIHAQSYQEEMLSRCEGDRSLGDEVSRHGVKVPHTEREEAPEKSFWRGLSHLVLYLGNSLTGCLVPVFLTLK